MHPGDTAWVGGAYHFHGHNVTRPQVWQAPLGFQRLGLLRVQDLLKGTQEGAMSRIPRSVSLPAGVAPWTPLLPLACASQTCRPHGPFAVSGESNSHSLSASQ